MTGVDGVDGVDGMDGVVARTDRLVVRPWRHDEAPRLLDLLSRLEVIRWLDDDVPVPMKDLDEAHARIDRYHQRSTEPPTGFWAVEVRDTGVVAGSVLLLPLEDGDPSGLEVGWHLHPDSWGHGYAAEAAAPVIERALAHGVPEVVALTNLDNHPSIRVCEALGLEDLGVTERWYPLPSRHFRATRATHPGPSPDAGSAQG